MCLAFHSGVRGDETILWEGSADMCLALRKVGGTRGDQTFALHGMTLFAVTGVLKNGTAQADMCLAPHAVKGARGIRHICSEG